MLTFDNRSNKFLRIWMEKKKKKNNLMALVGEGTVKEM